MNQQQLQRCQELIGYTFANPDLLALALTHASVAPTRMQSNERMEFLGDAVLGLVVCHDLYESYEELMEGEMTQIKSAVVSRHVCAIVADQTGLSDLMHLGKGMSAEGVPQSVSAAVLEAVIGAIYLDGGLAPARQFILTHMRSHIVQMLEEAHQKNYKSMLQQLAQRRWSITPDYALLDEKGPDHSKCFEIAVSIGGKHYPSAWGRSKKEAEQKAAHSALLDLGVLKEEPAEDRAI